MERAQKTPNQIWRLGGKGRREGEKISRDGKRIPGFSAVLVLAFFLSLESV